MNVFPDIDPIPLPAPVWLFKALHVLTLALHFISVQMLVGGLLLAVLLNFLGGRSKSANPNLHLGAAAAIAKRLPIVMTYVINLGVPPLLFAQVLYGRALYTSSVLIGAWWIAVIPLLILCYWILYRFAAGAEAGRPVWWLGGAAWVLAALIARIYSTNMTLMLRPEVWGGMYSADAFGAGLPPTDPVLMPRLLFMLLGGIGVTGLWLLWIGSRKSVDAKLAGYLHIVGGVLAVVGVAAQGGMLWWLLSVVPATVRDGLMGGTLYQGALGAWGLGAVLAVLFGALAVVRRCPVPVVGAWASPLVALILLGGWTLFRDGMRDLSLSAKGFDVWNRTIVTNWSVVGLFVLVFVVGLGAMGWLVSVVARARTQAEGGLS
jgi:hypothetical protein